MERQLSFAQQEYARKKNTPRRDKFLTEMNQVVPWARLVELIGPHYPKGKRAMRPYMVCVMRGIANRRRQVFPIALQQRLPRIPIPLRSTVEELSLELQPLLDRCYEMGRHWQEDFSLPLDPPLAEDEQKWVAQRLREAGLLE